MDQEPALSYTKPTRVSLQNHPVLNEKWVQDRIAEDPSILDLGEIVLKDRERIQPHAGRLDLLFQDAEEYRRYEVELQLGETNESHIIRTIEYWDIERKRYPQYEHVAVLVAEDITSRFLNVISLINGAIPFIAIQMQAFSTGNNISLIFTTVLDQRELGYVDEDEEVAETTDRNYWENRATKQTVEMADNLLDLIHEFAPDHFLKYNKFYIGLASQGVADNFVTFKPKKNWLNLGIRLDRSEEILSSFEKAGLEGDHDSRYGWYNVRVGKEDISSHKQLLSDLMHQAYTQSHK